MSPYPLLLIVLGAVVLGFGKRLSVLGAAVGAMLGIWVLSFSSGENNLLFQLLLVGGLAAAGFFFAGLAKGIVDIVLLVLSILAGALIFQGIIERFTPDFGWFQWLLVAVGGVVGLMLFRRFGELAMIVLAGLIGGILVTRGLTVWLPILQGPLGTLLILVLAGAGIGTQSGYFAGRKAAAAEKSAAAAQAAAAAPPASNQPVAAAPMPSQASAAAPVVYPTSPSAASPSAPAPMTGTESAASDQGAPTAPPPGA